MHVVVEGVIPLARHFIDTVDIRRPQAVPLIDRKILRAAVYLSCAGVDDLDLGVVVAARFQDRKLCPAVDLQIGVRIRHRIEMARLTRQIEQHVSAAHQVSHAMLITYVGDVHRHMLLDAVDIE
jgi:hypothetical protein